MSKTRAQIAAEIAANFPDNTSGAITPDLLRTTVSDISLAAPNLADDGTPVPNTRTINGHALSSDVTVTASDVGLGNVNNTSDANKPVSTAQAAADALVASNAATDATTKANAAQAAAIAAAAAGNAATATKLQTARTLNGVSFDGSANVTVPPGTGPIASVSTNQTPVATDNEGVFRATASISFTLNNLATGTKIYITSIGANVISFVAGSGMSISGSSGISGNGAFATLVQISSTVWEVYASTAIASSIFTGLFAFYPLDESPTTTTCRDEVGGETVTATAGSASAVGKTRLRCRLMAAITNQAYLSTNNAADFKFNRGAGAITVSGWVKATSLTNVATIASLFTTTGNKRVWLLEVSTAGKAQFTVSTDGTGAGNVTASSTATLVTGTWYFLVGYYNPTTGKVGIVVNAGTPDEASIGTGMFVTTGIPMNIGAREASATVSAALQDIGFWSRNLTTAEITYLYSSGNGITYPFLQ